jgi:hypothetical protein
LAGLCVFVLAVLLSLLSLERVVTHQLRRLYFGMDIPMDQFIAHSCDDHHRNRTRKGDGVEVPITLSGAEDAR